MKRLLSLWLVLALCLLAGCSALVPRDTPEDLALMHREAQAAFDRGDDAKALALYQKLTVLARQDAQTWLRLGNLFARTGQAESAAVAYRQALLINPGDVRALNNLGVVLLRQSWQSFVRVQQIAPAGDPVHASSTQMIEILERMPSVIPEKSR